MLIIVTRLYLRSILVCVLCLVLFLQPVFSEPPANDPLLKTLPALQFYDERTQILKQQIIKILRVIYSIDNPRILIWGVGYDSRLWCAAGNGKTIFIENSPKWAELIAPSMPCKVVMVRYSTRLKQADYLLRKPEKLNLLLPEKLASQKFDVILIDAPFGGGPNSPGRMQSIFMSRKLADPAGHVFVDDYKRRVERLYSTRFLKPFFGKPTLLKQRGFIAHFHRSP